jgi:hypothetical protein
MKNMTETQPAIEFTVSGVCERDIDLLLLEEFVASPDFVEWFAQAAGLAWPGEIGPKDLLLSRPSVNHRTTGPPPARLPRPRQIVPVAGVSICPAA